jgi:membrane fusion protein, heavy metal efflux system
MRKQFYFILASFSLFGTGVLTSCKGHEEKVEAKETAFVVNDSIAKLITIDTVQSHLLEGNLELNGEVSFNQNTVVRVMPIVSGTAQLVNAQLGDYVTQGQILATVRSGDLASQQSELSAAQAALNVSRKNLEVVKELEIKGINSQKQVLEAQEENTKNEASVRSIQQRLSIIGGAQTGGEVVVRAPVSGYIVERNINPNQVVDPGSDKPLFTVSDLKQVWVIASVYETDIEKVKMGEQVKITTVAYPDKVYNGTINYISNVLDAENKTLKVRVVLNNPSAELKPEMFAKVMLDYRIQQMVPAIPHDAVVFDDSKNYVVVYEGRDKLSIRKIELYPTHDHILYVRSGLNVGETIISRNQLIIYNALTAL